MKKTLLAFLLAFACIIQAQQPARAPKPLTDVSSRIKTSDHTFSGIFLNGMDTVSVKPGDDFYTYCNGAWQKRFNLPASDARYGSFNEINDNNLNRIRGILREAAMNNKAAPNTDAQRLRDFFNTAWDSLRADSLKARPIMAQIEQINKVTSLDELMKLKSEFDFIGVNLFFSAGVSPDAKNSKKNSFGIYQGGLGLGERDYYYDESFEKIRASYKKYVGALFDVALYKESKINYGEEVFEFEKKLADKAFTRLQMRDVEKMYNVYNPKTLSELTPAIKWTEYFKVKNIRMPDTVIVGMVDYMKELNALLTSTPLETLKMYAKAQLLMEAAPYLSQVMVNISFGFRGNVMSGATQMKPRWKRIQSVLDNCMGDIVAREFVNRFFKAEAKAKVDTMIDNLVAAYRERIASRTWMSDETKKQANRKLDLLIRKVGYPAKWKDYTGLTIGKDNYWANVCRATRFQVQDNLNDLKKPVDRNKWQMTAVTVNAYYDPTTNEITFPAAILQPPFFNPMADNAANYGTMGSIIGHELTHGFDDQGAQFDADGNMKMWWTEEDFKNFKAKTEQVVKQYDAYVLLDSLHVNGSMTQGENIADLGGLTMSYHAYQKSLKGKPSPKMDGFTGEQRFFIAWTQGWKSKARDQEIKRLLTVDYHAPAYFRAFAPLTNLKEFQEAFHVKPSNKLYVPDNARIEIW